MTADLLTLAREALEDDRRAGPGPWRLACIARARTREPELARGVLALSEELAEERRRVDSLLDQDRDKTLRLQEWAEEEARLRQELATAVGLLRGARGELSNYVTGANAIGMEILDDIDAFLASVKEDDR